MRIVEEIKKKSIGFKKALTAVILFVLAVPLFIVVVFNAQKRLTNFDQKQFQQNLNLPEQEAATTTDYFSQAMLELEEAVLELKQTTQTTSTATSSAQELLF